MTRPGSVVAGVAPSRLLRPFGKTRWGECIPQGTSRCIPRVSFTRESRSTSRRTTMETFRRICLALFGLLLATQVGPAARAIPGPEEADTDTDPKVSAYLSHSALPPGGAGTVLVLLEIPNYFHIQMNDFLELIVPEEAPIALGPMTAPATGTWEEEPVLKGKSTLKAPFEVKPDAPPGATTLRLTVGYQGCTEGPIYACYPPGEAEISLNLEIVPPEEPPRLAHQEIFAAHGGPLDLSGEGASGSGGATAAGPDVPGKGQDLASRLEGALAKGSLAAFLLVFLGGVLTSFTPCVYPMIPITISFVGGRARSRLQGFILAVFFVLGLAIMYSVLGLAAASTGAVFGSVMQSPAAMIVVAVIFAAMGVSMLGAFEIALPAGLTTRMAAAGSGAGGNIGGAGTIIGAILMGVTTGVVASPCVGPVLVVLLTFVAKTGNLLYGFWLLFTFASGLGLLFLVLGTFAGALNALPGAGSWMNTVKHIFGVILIAMAIFYLRGLLGPQISRFVLGVYLVLVGVFAGAFTPLAESPGRGALFRKSAGILIFLSGAVIFLLWLFALIGVPGVATPGAGGAGVAPGGAGSPTAARPGVAWRVNDEGALEEAKAHGKPVIQDFYADWCVACVELDEETWTDPGVVEESRRYVPVKMDFTKQDEFSKGATKRYAIRGMPTVILYDSQGNEVTRFFGFKGPADVLKIMRSVQ